MKMQKMIRGILFGFAASLALVATIGEPTHASTAGNPARLAESQAQNPVGTVKWEISDDTLVLHAGTIYGRDISYYDDYPWANNTNIVHITIDGDINLNDSAADNFFADLPKLQSISGLEHIKLDNADSAHGMFLNDPNLISLDLSSFDTSKIRYMGSMFENDKSLTSLDLSNWNLTSLDTTVKMFASATGLKSIKLPEDMHTLNHVQQMFENCLSLESIDLSNMGRGGMKDYGGGMLNNTPNLWKITLGTKFGTLDSIYLGNVPEYGTKVPDSNNSNYIVGPKSSEIPKWQAVGNGTDHNPQGKKYTVDEIVGQYDTSPQVMTFVWQQERIKDLSKIDVHDVNLTVGDKWEPKLGFTSATDVDGNTIELNKVTVTGNVNTNVAGDYNVTYTNGSATKTITVRVTAKASPNPNPVNPIPNPKPTPTPTPTPTNPNWNPSNPNNPNGTGLPNYAAVKGSAVYATKKIYMYKHGNFKKSQRIATYPKQKRINRPMFVVTGYTYSNGGALRYKVRDVNHHSKTAGKRGYITANRKYVVRVYYQSVPKKKLITVINPKGVHAYKNRNLTKQVKHYKKGSHLHVKKIVKWNLTTRYQLTNGHYVTANKKLVIQGKY